MNFVQASLKNRPVTLTVLAMVFAIGIYSLLTMPRREDPQITIPAGLLISYYPGANAAQIEEQLTKPLEEYLFRFNEVLKSKTHSTTRDGISIISVWLTEDIHQPDIFWNKLRHQLLIAKSLKLPEGVVGPLVDSDFGDTEAMLISLEGNDVSYSDLNDYARKLEERLRQIEASSKIKKYGEQKEQITIHFDSGKLAQTGISLQQITQIIQSSNTIKPTGSLSAEGSSISFYTSVYQSIEDIKQQIVGISKTGNTVRLGDLTSIQREFAEPDSYIRVNEKKAMLISVQMHEGNNIVWFGNDVKEMLKDFERTLPASIEMTTIVDQPRIVDENISGFLREFVFAIIAVIIVILILLPFRVAAVAAMAIPMTIAVTFTFLQLFGTELHQVSLSALIVVLGMVVDDAIVVADNYVELLDRGVDRWNAAWRSAYDLIIPILTATVTIIAAFLPIIILTGPIGEFIHDLPVTVTIALSSSFLVAMLLTPLLCFAFIQKGLYASAENKVQGLTVLNRMQLAYNKTIDWAANHPLITIAGSLFTILLAIGILKFGIKRQFMPYAERDQFVVELWMPTGTSLEKTHQAILKLESLIKQDKRVRSVAAFSGMSAPRVYYNFSPEMPVSNYGQLLVNTVDFKATESLAAALTDTIESLVPEGLPQIRLMQQGQPMAAPIEVRIYGEEWTQLQAIAQDIKLKMREIPGTTCIQDDSKEDFYGIDIQMKPEAARLGFSSAMVSQYVYAGFSGYTVSKLYEGDKAVDVRIRLNETERNSITDLNDMYVQSPVTGASIPMRQIVSMVPNWKPGRILHRNGIRCLTVRADAAAGYLPSELLDQLKPKLAAMQMPPEYRIEYGGEKANQEEVFGRLSISLGISLILIFLVLLFQFRNLREPILVMLSIPLSLFGAISGLWLTGNNLGFTAFVGLISLSGIVVRNAIILIDHTKELLKSGLDVRTAAVEAGKRRLRPIFLTAMAAAVGVLPMIVSGSSLWSPLASVIAFGVTWSMLISLLAIPVMYSVFIKINKEKAPAKPVLSSKGIVTIIFLLIFIGLPVTYSFSQSDNPVKLSLETAGEMALQNNHLLKIKDLQIREKEQKIKEDKVNFFPMISVNGNYQYNTGISELVIEQGSFGSLTFGTLVIPMPAANDTFAMGEHDTYNASVVLYQPLTQLPKIHSGAKLSAVDAAMARVEKEQSAAQILQAVEKVYYGVAIAGKQLEEAEVRVKLARLKLYDAESAVIAGKAKESDLSGLQALLAGEEQTALVVSMQQEEYLAALRQLIGMESGQRLELEPILAYSADSLIISQLIVEDSLGIAENRELKLASLSREKAKFALKAGQYGLMPDLGLIAGYSYQKGNLIFPENNNFIGLTFKWNVQGLATSHYQINQRKLMMQQAMEKLEETRSKLQRDEENALRKLRQVARLVQVAEKARHYRELDFNTKLDKFESGLALQTEVLEAEALLKKAEADAFAAQLNFRIAQSELQFLRGR